MLIFILEYWKSAVGNADGLQVKKIMWCEMILDYC